MGGWCQLSRWKRSNTGPGSRLVPSAVKQGLAHLPRSPASSAPARLWRGGWHGDEPVVLLRGDRFILGGWSRCPSNAREARVVPDSPVGHGSFSSCCAPLADVGIRLVYVV